MNNAHMTDEEYREAFKERVAIIYEGSDMTLAQAEYLARQCVNAEYNRRILKGEK